METDLDSLWILSTTGLCFIHRIFDENKDFGDETIFSGFISAILSFCNSTISDTVEQISLGKFDLHLKTYPDFIVVISIKKQGKIKNHSDLIEKIAKEFDAEYRGFLGKKIPTVETFSPFGENIDRIFGIKSIQIIPEHEQLIELIRKTDNEQIPEEVAVNMIIDFFKSLPDFKRTIIIENINKILISVAKNPQSIGMLLSPQQIDLTKELEEFNLLLEQAKNSQMSEDELIIAVVTFFNKISQMKFHLLLQHVGKIIRILEPSKHLSKEYKKKFSELIKLSQVN